MTPARSWTAAVRAQDGAEAGSAASPGRGRILIVEDEYFVAIDTESALLDAGFIVVGIAATAEEAVALAEAERPEVVLMDIRLVGERDGIDAAAEIRRKFGIPSLFATAHSDAATRARGDGAAAPLSWLTKPYTHAELTTVMALAIASVRRGATG